MKRLQDFCNKRPSGQNLRFYDTFRNRFRRLYEFGSLQPSLCRLAEQNRTSLER